MISVPGNPVQKGPGARSVGFYNSSQRINRDISILFLQSRMPRLALDAFGGTGIRGIRFNKEAGVNTVISEINPASCGIIEENAARNSAGVEVHNERFERTLERHLFDYIDIDPYGSIIPYADAAIQAVRNRGYVAVTATDLSALTGSAPRKTWRRYGSAISNDVFRHEMGIRLLIAYVVRRAAAYDIMAVPEVSLWHSHFYRVIFRIEHGAARADSALSLTGSVNKHDLLDASYMDEEEGPVWLGKLNNMDTLRDMTGHISSNTGKDAEKVLDILGNDDMSMLFFELTDMARIVRSNVPPIAAVSERLSEIGIPSGRTHFSRNALKISGNYDDLFSDMRRFFPAFKSNV